MTFDHAFHGRTLLTMTLTSKVKPYKLGFGPFAPEVYRMPNAYCYRCPFGLRYPSCGVACADYLEEFFVGNVAAMTFGPVMRFVCGADFAARRTAASSASSTR